jgi:hypothetical protein
MKDLSAFEDEIEVEAEILRKLRMTIQCVNIVNSIAYKNHSPLVILRNEGSYRKC